MVGDCRDLPLPDESVEAVVTDPPYGLDSFIGEWDKAVPGPEAWSEVLRVSKPGAMCMAFGGTRTHHWLAVALEEAGWALRDELCWLRPNGFVPSPYTLKPSWEPIVVAMNPVDTISGNRDSIGLGGVFAEQARVGNTEAGAIEGVSDGHTGRWPPNVAFEHSPCCNGECAECCPGAMIDADSGVLDVPGSYTGDVDQNEVTYGDMGFKGGKDRYHIGYGDSGGASRFYYQASASRSEREAGLPDVEGRANRHPTVKPIDLCRWLVRLVTRPDHTVLDPFMGSGSIGCAAVQERRDYIGLDLEPEYVEVARQRIEHWTPKQRDLFKD